MWSTFKSFKKIRLESTFSTLLLPKTYNIILKMLSSSFNYVRSRFVHFQLVFFQIKKTIRRCKGDVRSQKAEEFVHTLNAYTLKPKETHTHGQSHTFPCLQWVFLWLWRPAKHKHGATIQSGLICDPEEQRVLETRPNTHLHKHTLTHSRTNSYPRQGPRLRLNQGKNDAGDCWWFW